MARALPLNLKHPDSAKLAPRTTHGTHTTHTAAAQPSRHQMSCVRLQFDGPCDSKCEHPKDKELCPSNLFTFW